jgi:hypothetical protein
MKWRGAQTFTLYHLKEIELLIHHVLVLVYILTVPVLPVTNNIFKIMLSIQNVLKAVAGSVVPDDLSN